MALILPSQKKLNTRYSKITIMAQNSMMLAHLDRGTSEYVINLDNEEIEDHLKENVLSSASDFKVILSPQLELAPLLFLKSCSAQLGVSQLNVDSLPLTCSRLEKIKVFVHTPPKSGTGNALLNEISIEERNKIPLEIPLSDMSTDDAAEVIDFLNEKVFYQSISDFLVSRYLTLFFDKDIFINQQLTTFSKSEVNLLYRYINITLYVRHLVHDMFKEIIAASQPDLLNDETNPADPALTEDLKGLWKYGDEVQETLTKAGETKILNSSENLKLRDERIEARSFMIVDFGQFYGHSIRAIPNEVKEAIKTDFLNRLQEQDIFSRGLNIDPSQLARAKSYFLSNRMMIEYGLLARNMVGLLAGLYDKRKKDEILFESRIIALKLDDSKSKCYVHFVKKNFLPSDGGTVQIDLPKHLGYVLGGRVGRPVTIGPISLLSPPVVEPRLTENLVSSQQRLPQSIHPLPKLIHCCSDLIVRKTRDYWMNKSPFVDQSVIFTFPLDDEHVSRRFISKICDTITYHRLQNVHNILNSFRLCLVDEYYQPLRFAPRTITSISLTFQPVEFESL